MEVAIVDYGLGNLFSVKHACEHLGLEVEITPDKAAILSAKAVILPGVGAFGDAMETLRKLDLIEPLKTIAAEGKPLLGICLGMQLLMSESQEFGSYKGLGFIDGTVIPFQNVEAQIGGHIRTLKVPQVCWNTVCSTRNWNDTMLEGVNKGESMYFVHSYHVVPQREDIQLAYTQYGNTTFCCSLQKGNIFACQFHPERSGQAGLQIYRNLANLIRGY